MATFFLVCILCFLMVQHNSAISDECAKSRGAFKRLDKVNLSVYSVKPQQASVNPLLTPVILVHGLTSAKEGWNYVIQQIADATGRKVYSFDIRNHGESSWSDIISVRAFLADLSNLMEQLDIPKSILVGHSLGGKIAMDFALRTPFKVEKLVIEDISPLTRASKTEAYVYVELLQQALKEIPPEIQKLDDAKNLVANYVLRKTPVDHRSDRHGYYDKSVWPLKRAANGTFQWKTNLDAVKILVDCDMDVASASHGRYEGPTLFLYGTKSPYKVYKDKAFTLTLFPKAVFKGFEGAAHQLHLEYKNEFLRTVIPFLKGK